MPPTTCGVSVSLTERRPTRSSPNALKRGHNSQNPRARRSDAPALATSQRLASLCKPPRRSHNRTTRRLFRIKRPSCRNWLAFAALQPQMAKRPASEMWSEMAAEVRAMAERTRHPRDRTRLLEIAVSYDRLAARAAEMERGGGGQRTEDPTIE